VQPELYARRLEPVAAHVSQALGKRVDVDSICAAVGKFLTAQRAVVRARRFPPPSPHSTRPPRPPHAPRTRLPTRAAAGRRACPCRCCATCGPGAGCRSSSSPSPASTPPRPTRRVPSPPPARAHAPQPASRLGALREALSAAGALAPLRFAFAPDLPPAAREAAAAQLARFGGSPAAEAASATHLLSGAEPPALGGPADGEPVSCLDEEAGLVLLHALRAAASADAWLPRAEAPEGARAAQPPPPPPACWTLPLAWLAASAAAGELLPEADWELRAPAAPGGKRARGAAPLAEEAAKRARAAAALPGVAPRRAPEAALADGAIAAASAGDGAAAAAAQGVRLEALSAGQRTQLGVAPPRLPPSGPLPPPRAAGGAAAGLPAFASWFRFDAISELERRGLPEFFRLDGGPKSADSFRRARNAIVTRHRELGGRRLTFSEARAMLPAGDAAALQRLFAFLEHWGVINCGASRGDAAAHAQPPAAAQRAAAQLAAAPPPAAPEALRLLSSAGGARPCHALFEFDPVRSAVAPLGGAAPHGAAAAQRVATLGARPAPACNACGCDLSQRPRQHCVRLPELDLCLEHYTQGRFPAGVSSADFARLEAGAGAPRAQPAAAAAGRWSEGETLLLLEALETRGDDWAAVAQHVGNKSAAQCVAHFLALPIEDRFLDVAEGRPAAALAGGQGPPPQPLPAPPPPQQPPLPFADAGNPLLAQVAFVAAVAGPRVAAAAAQAALAALEAEGAAAAAELSAEAGGLGDEAQRRGAAAGLAAAAVKAKLLADQEERDAQRLVVGLIDSQLRKVELKLRALEELDAALLDGAREVEARRATMAEDSATMAAYRLLSERKAERAAAMAAENPQ